LYGQLVIINIEDSKIKSTLDLPKSMANIVPIQRPALPKDPIKAVSTPDATEAPTEENYIFSTLGHDHDNGFLVAGFRTKVSALKNIEILDIVQKDSVATNEEAVVNSSIPWQLEKRFHSEWKRPPNVLPVNLFFTQSGKTLVSIGTDDAIRRWHLQDDWTVDDPVRTTIGITADIGDKCLSASGLPVDRRLAQESFDAAAVTMINVDRHLDCSGRLLSVRTLSGPSLSPSSGSDSGSGSGDLISTPQPSNPRSDKLEGYYFTHTVDRIALSPNSDYFLISSGNHVRVWQTRSGAGSEKLDDARLVSELCTRLQAHFGSALNGSDDDPQLSNLRKTCQAYSN
jgi:hypothetical protein